MRRILDCLWRSEHKSYLIALCILFTMGAALLGMDLGATDFLGDEYINMEVVHKPLLEYIHSLHYGLALKIQFWVCNRFFGDSLAGYRLPGMISGVLHLLLVLVLVRRFWPNNLALPLYVGLMLGFNWQCLWFCRFGMASYGEYILLSGLLFFIFLRLTEGPLKRYWIPLVTLVFAVIPYINFALLIPFFVGFFLIFLLRIYQTPGNKIRAMLATAWELKYFSIGFAMFAIVRVVLNVAWNMIVHRPQLDPYYFKLSGYAQDLSGVLSFGWDKTLQLLHSLTATVTMTEPFEIGGSLFWPDVFLKKTCLWLLLIGIAIPLLVQLLKGHLSFERLFSICYFSLCLLSILILGLLGFFPYGNARYAMFLLVPGLILSGLGLSDVFEWVFLKPVRMVLDRFFRNERFGAFASWGKRLAFLVIIAFFAVVGWDRLLFFHKARVAERAGYDRIVKVVQDDHSDIVLLDARNAFWLMVRAPEVLAMAEKIVTVDGQKKNPSKALSNNMLAESSPINTALVITWKKSWDDSTEEDYPGYVNLFFKQGFKTVLSHGQGGDYVARLAREGLALTQTAVERRVNPLLPTKIIITGWTVTNDAVLKVRGWVLSPRKIEAIVVSSGSNPMGEAGYPVPDKIAYKYFPEYRNKEAGFIFQGSIDLDQIADGSIEIQAFADGELLGSKKLKLVH